MPSAAPAASATASSCHADARIPWLMWPATSVHCMEDAAAESAAAKPTLSGPPLHAIKMRSPLFRTPPRRSVCSSARSGCVPRTLTGVTRDFALHVALCGRFPLVPQPLALSQANLDLYFAAREIQAQRYDRQSLLRGTPAQADDLLLVQQQLARTVRIDVRKAALFVRRHVHPEQPQLAVAHPRVRFVQADPALPNRLDLRARQRDARLHRFQNVEFVAGAPIVHCRRGMAFFFGSLRFPGLFGLSHLRDFADRSRHRCGLVRRNVLRLRRAPYRGRPERALRVRARCGGSSARVLRSPAALRWAQVYESAHSCLRSRRDTPQHLQHAPSLRPAARGRCRRGQCRANLDTAERGSCGRALAHRAPVRNASASRSRFPGRTRSSARRRSGSTADAQARSQCMRQLRVDYLLLHLADRVLVPHPAHDVRRVVEENEARHRIQVARLADAADVDDVAFAVLQSEFAAALHVLMADASVGFERVVLGDVRVPDENDGGVGALESSLGVAFIEQVLEIMDRRAVHEQIPLVANLVAQTVEPLDNVGLDDALRPLDRAAGGRIEVLHSEIIDRGDVVIAQHGLVRAIADRAYAFVRVGAVSDDVAQTQDAIALRNMFK